MVKLDGATPEKSCRTTLHGGSNHGSLMEDIRAIAVDPTQRWVYTPCVYFIRFSRVWNWLSLLLWRGYRPRLREM